LLLPLTGISTTPGLFQISSLIADSEYFWNFSS